MATHRAQAARSRTSAATPRSSPPGKRRAIRSASATGVSGSGKRRGSRSNRPNAGLPFGLPIVAGLVTLTAATAGAVLEASAEPPPGRPAHPTVVQASALGHGAEASEQVSKGRASTLSRDGRRDAGERAGVLAAQSAAEATAARRIGAFKRVDAAARKYAASQELNRWVLPLERLDITAEFGQYSGLWATFHTGIDFNGDAGDAIRAVAAGVVSSTGYEGSYGNKTVVTLIDGTEIWYGHQSSINVVPGERVHAGQVIGSVGSTGNVTGSHLHLEVRPGAGDPVDPRPAFAAHGVEF